MVLPVLSRAFAGASAGAGLSLLKQIGAGDRPGHYRNFPNAFMRIAFVAGTYQPNRCGVAHYTACLRSHLTPGYRVGRLDDSGKRRCNCQIGCAGLAAPAFACLGAGDLHQQH